MLVVTCMSSIYSGSFLLLNIIMLLLFLLILKPQSFAISDNI